jgi:hypothetical protein
MTVKQSLEQGLGKIAKLTNFSFVLDIINLTVIVLLVIFVLAKNTGGVRDKVVTATESLVDSSTLPSNRIRARYLLEQDTQMSFDVNENPEGTESLELATYKSSGDTGADDDKRQLERAKRERAGMMTTLEKRVKASGFDMDNTED